MKTGIEIVASERSKQINNDGWTPEHDDQHVNGELAMAGACYALHPFIRKDGSTMRWSSEGHRDVPEMWPWEGEWWKPTENDRIKELGKAGALIVAEIDRIQRLKK